MFLIQNLQLHPSGTSVVLIVLPKQSKLKDKNYRFVLANDAELFSLVKCRFICYNLL